MEKTKIIYLRTENMVNYYINVENYQYIPRSSPNSKSAAGVQLVSFSGSIATNLWGLYPREIIFLKIQETI